MRHDLRLQALVRTLYISGAFAAADTLLKIIIVFGMHIPLFLYGCALLSFFKVPRSSSVRASMTIFQGECHHGA